MKNSFKLFSALSIAFLGMIYACTNSHQIQKVAMPVDSIGLLASPLRELVTVTPVVQKDTVGDSIYSKITSISILTQNINKINEKQNGVCDTCVTGYQSAIIENRLVAEQLSKETFELRDKLSKIQMLKSNADKEISMINNQTAEMNNIVAVRRSLIRQSQREIEDYKRSNVLTARY